MNRYIIYADSHAGHPGYVAFSGRRLRRYYHPTAASFERLGRITYQFYCTRINHVRSVVEISERNHIRPHEHEQPHRRP